MNIEDQVKSNTEIIEELEETTTKLKIDIYGLKRFKESILKYIAGQVHTEKPSQYIQESDNGKSEITAWGFKRATKS